MKHLKTYSDREFHYSQSESVFRHYNESNSDEEILQNIVLDIEDICQDLKDYNFELDWDNIWFKGSEIEIPVFLRSKNILPTPIYGKNLVIRRYRNLVNPTPFIFNEEVSEVINRIKDYLKLNNCGYKIGYSYPYMEDEPLNILSIDPDEKISQLGIKFWLK